MAVYKVGDSRCPWTVGNNQKNEWYAWKGHPNGKADAGPFRTRKAAINWITNYG